MKTPTIVGKLIADLIDRGLKRDDLAKALGVRPSTISQYKNGRGTLDDEKIGTLARLHGAYSERELLTLKHLEWLEFEKGITINDIRHALVSREKSSKAA